MKGVMIVCVSPTQVASSRCDRELREELTDVKRGTGPP